MNDQIYRPPIAEATTTKKIDRDAHLGVGPRRH